MQNKKYDVIVVGELNVDLILNHLEGFPEVGKEKIAGNMDLTLGSSSAIFACNLSSLGAKVAFLGRVGNDSFGELVIETLKNKGVGTEYLIKDSEYKTGATIILNYSEDRAMVTYPGAMNNLTINDIKPDIINSAKHLHFSSYYLQPGIKNDVGSMFRLAKDNGLTTSFDMQWDPAEKWDMDSKSILPYVDVFLPNEQELLYLTSAGDMENGIKALQALSNHIAVKLGSKGSLLCSGGKSSFRKSFLNNNVIDCIGAGDSFNAGFIYKYVSGAELSECQEFANLTGAINTTAAGGTTAFSSIEKIKKTAKERFGVNI
jgi:sugar/nucleoside kinase (ribokinase family)